MAVTIDPITDGDYIRLNRGDAIANWSAGGSFNMIALNTSSQVENTGAIQVRVPAGIGSLTCAAAGFPGAANANLENAHLRHWIKLGQSISAGATYGARVILGTEANHGSWVVYDDATQVVVYNGWMMLVVDPRKPYDAEVGTAPTDILSVANAGSRVDFVDGNGKDLTVGDMLWQGNEVSVEGGTSGARGTFAEWATDDESNGYGILRPVGGVYYINSGAVFQGVGTAVNYFEDANRILIFEDLPVSGTLYTFRHVGNSDVSINSFQLGTTSGSGVDQEGAGGGVMQSAGAAPFRVIAIDANVDAVNYYGVTMLGPAAIYADQLRNVKAEDNGTGFTDITSDATGPDLAIVDLMPATEADNDATYFGHDRPFYALNLNLSTGKAGTWTGVWEYYDGTAWQLLTDLTDGTANFVTTGAQSVTWTIPDDWATTAIDSDTRYWVRFRIETFTSSGAGPAHSASGCTCDMAGDVRIEDPNVDFVGCSLSGMGSVRVRNGAFLKKTTLDSSRASAKHAALDLGALDPATNTIRDLTIQNCSKGVLLKDYTRFFNAAAAVNKGGGLVGIPSTAHAFPTGRSITIAGTTNYNGDFTVDATSSANEIVITASFVAETFATTDSAVPNGVWNIRNFQFSGNTNDFRVDYPATSDLTINLIDGSSSDTALTQANQDIVNVGTTVTFVNTVTLTVTVLDSNGAAVEGAGVRMELVSDGSIVMEGTTNASGVVTDSTFNYSIDTDVLTKVRLKGFRYFRTAGTIINTGISVGVTLQTNKIVDLP